MSVGTYVGLALILGLMTLMGVAYWNAARRPRGLLPRRARDVAPLPVPDAATLHDLPRIFDACPACGCLELVASAPTMNARSVAAARPKECAHCGWYGIAPDLTPDDYATMMRALNGEDREATSPARSA